MSTILILNGPNLNLLGVREPNQYGHHTLDDVLVRLEDLADEHQVRLWHFQSNAEHELIERVHRAHQEEVDCIVINPAAFTHTSVALRDALSGVNIPFVECHISNVHAREPFRHHSYFSDVAIGVVAGFGTYSYELALQAAIQWLATHP